MQLFRSPVTTNTTLRPNIFPSILFSNTQTVFPLMWTKLKVFENRILTSFSRCDSICVLCWVVLEGNPYVIIHLCFSLYLSIAESLEENFKRSRTESSAEDADIMQSKRRLTETDICVVASQLGASWRVLGLRLNFPSETLDAIAQTTAIRFTDNSFEKVGASTRSSIITWT
jgi:hypothetical protein